MPIVVRFGSGLGNQLFQYAAAYALAKSNNETIEADLSSYFLPQRTAGRVIFRPFALGDLGFPIYIRTGRKSSLSKVRGYSRLRNYVRYLGYAKYCCHGGYRSEFNLHSGKILLSGYFQDIRYFHPCLDELASDIRKSLEIACTGSWDPLPGNVGALHVRLGDYLNHPEFHPEWFRDYVKKAAKDLLDVKGMDKVVVFSDDSVLAFSYFSSFGGRVEVAEPNPCYQGAPDLLRMASAKTLVIANSSFSWWAGILARQQGGEVIAPERWSTWCDDPQFRLYPETWTIWGNPQ